MGPKAPFFMAENVTLPQGETEVRRPGMMPRWSVLTSSFAMGFAAGYLGKDACAWPLVFTSGFFGAMSGFRDYQNPNGEINQRLRGREAVLGVLVPPILGFAFGALGRAVLPLPNV